MLHYTFLIKQTKHTEQTFFARLFGEANHFYSVDDYYDINIIFYVIYNPKMIIAMSGLGYMLSTHLEIYMLAFSWISVANHNNEYHFEILIKFKCSKNIESNRINVVRHMLMVRFGL